MRQRSFVALFALALSTITVRASAAPVLRAQVTQHGDFVLLGSTLGYECGVGTPTPLVGAVGDCGLNTADSAPDIFWRADSPADGQAEANTGITPAQARTTSVLTLPPGALVTHAYIYWASYSPLGGWTPTATVDRVGAGAFSASLTALTTNTISNRFQSVADVTALVRAHGAGPYRVSGFSVPNLANVNDSNTFAGWWMVVLYELAGDPLRTLTIFDGMDGVANGVPQTAVLSGFRVPAAGAEGRLGVIAYDGDRSTTGDQLSFDGNVLSTVTHNPADNFFNGTRTTLDVPVSTAGDLPQLDGTPQSYSGVDLDVVDVTGYLAAGQTSATVTATTAGDVVILGGFITAINTFEPDFSTATMTAIDADGGEVGPGDVVMYFVSLTNTGTDIAGDTVFENVLPAGVTWVPSSLLIGSGANAGPKTDAAGDDQAEYDQATRTLRVWLGAGAAASTGGTVAPGASTTFSFQVTVDLATRGVVSSQGTLTSTGVASGLTRSSPTDGNDADSGAPPTTFFVEGCTSDASCPAPEPYCATSLDPNACVECVVDGQCGSLEPTCVSNVCSCVATGVELCDGTDNDCDGVIDDGLSLGAACGVGVGECIATGVYECDASGGVVCSAIAGSAQGELCNGLDDDCDGTPDNGNPGAGFACTSSYAGACAEGLTVCAGGTPGCAALHLPGTLAETCNTVDDDCDSTTDEGFGVGDACTVGVGACASTGANSCNLAGTAECSASAGSPQDELCDGIDNDCDGTVDDGDPGAGDACTTIHPGACADGVTMCTAGATACTSIRLPNTVFESCNAIDDDCDGTTDEGFGLGNACSVGVGACVADGTNVCGATGAVCSATAGTPVDESCDGIDNDCDGTVDNGNPGAGTACVTSYPGVCAAGLTTCTSGAPDCAAVVLPNALTETCNAADDDCDGTIDEGFALGDACTVGVGACEAIGANVCGTSGAACSATAGTPSVELCGNDVDEDCDGALDSGCADAGYDEDAGWDGGIEEDAGWDIDAAIELEDAGLDEDAGDDAGTDEDAGHIEALDAGPVRPDTGPRDAPGYDAGPGSGVRPIANHCGCRAVGGGGGSSAGFAMLLLAAALRRRRAKR